MDAKNILEKTFESRANVDEILNPNQLKKWFPKSTNPTSLQICCSALQKDRNEIFEKVNENIQNEFNVPISETLSLMDQASIGSGLLTEKYSMKLLVEHMNELQKVAEVQEEIIDEKIHQYMEEIQQLVEMLKDLGDRQEKQGTPEETGALSAIDTLKGLIDKV